MVASHTPPRVSQSGRGIMGPNNPLIPKRIDSECLNCEETRLFLLDGGDTDNDIAHYSCENCGHAIHLDLDPNGHPA